MCLQSLGKKELSPLCIDVLGNPLKEHNWWKTSIITNWSAQVHHYEMVYSIPFAYFFSFILLNHCSKSKMRSSGWGHISSMLYLMPPYLIVLCCTMTFMSPLGTVYCFLYSILLFYGHCPWWGQGAITKPIYFKHWKLPGDFIKPQELVKHYIGPKVPWLEREKKWKTN